MPHSGRLLEFLRARRVAILSLALLLQAALLYNVSSGRDMPLKHPLSDLPAKFQNWQMVADRPIDLSTLEVLRADETLSRDYTDPAAHREANLFVAYFKSQRTGQTPHSPKHCMPGSGWTQVSAGIISLTVPGRSQAIHVNRYVLTKGDQKAVVLYWYQANRRVIANEFRARFYLVLDAIRYHRTDTALVRVIVPVREGGSESEATSVGIDFVRAFFGTLSAYLPS
jgi:EpsI family protein